MGESAGGRAFQTSAAVHPLVPPRSTITAAPFANSCAALGIAACMMPGVGTSTAPTCGLHTSAEMAQTSRDVRLLVIVQTVGSKFV